MTTHPAAQQPISLTLEQALQQGIAHHQAGQLQDAERFYRAILQAQPNHPEANHNLGVLAVQVNQPVAGLPCFKAALEAGPDQDQYWLSYIDALIRSGYQEAARSVMDQGRRRGLQGEAIDALTSRVDHFQNVTPDTPEVARAIGLRETGCYKEASCLLQSWLVNNPQDVVAYAVLAQVLSLNKQDEPAWAALNAALSLNPALPVVQRNLARLLLKQHKLDEALGAAQSAYQCDAGDPENQLVLAAVLGAKGQNEQAFTLMENVLQSRPDYAEAYAGRAMLKLRAGDSEGALADAEKSLSIKPHLEQLWGMVASLRHQFNNLHGAIDMLEKALKYEPDNIGYLVSLGDFKRQTGAVEDSIIALQKAVVIAPDNLGAWCNLGSAFHQAGRISEAKAAYAEALEISPGNPVIIYNMGALAVEEEKFEIGLLYFNQVLEIKPDSADAHYGVGKILKELGRLNEAESSYRRALEIKPDFAEAHRNLGNILLTLGRLDEAESSYRLTLKIKPDFAEAYVNLGNALKDSGRLDEAEACYRQALEVNPNLSDARNNLGNILHAIAAKNSGTTFLDGKGQDFHGVRRQYENLPFPARNPEAEHYVLQVSPPDILGKINQYCFGGNRDYSKKFRVLVAGCGTGDSVIWLAHQLRGTQAEIVAIDISRASLNVAQARAEVRNLTNIRWVNGSLLDVSTLGLGRFDYITCLGVLHHLPDPAEGLAALESVLADGGAMAIMLYGAVGRSHIYAMQNILRQMTVGLDDPQERLAFAKKIVANLPAKNGFLTQEGMKAINIQYLQDDTNFWDTLLHEQDRAYTASEVRQFLGSAGLFLQAFISYQGIGAVTSLQYDLDLYIDDASQRERLKALPISDRENIAELLDGSLALHTVYATRSPTSSLSPSAPNAILSPMSLKAQKIIAYLRKTDRELPIVLSNGSVLSYKPSAITRSFLAEIDGLRSNAEIAHSLGIYEGSEELAIVNQELRIPAALHWVIARTSSGSCISPLADIHKLEVPLYHFEPITLLLPPSEN